MSVIQPRCITSVAEVLQHHNKYQPRRHYSWRYTYGNSRRSTVGESLTKSGWGFFFLLILVPTGSIGEIHCRVSGETSSCRHYVQRAPRAHRISCTPPKKKTAAERRNRECSKEASVYFYFSYLVFMDIMNYVKDQ